MAHSLQTTRNPVSSTTGLASSGSATADSARGAGEGSGREEPGAPDLSQPGAALSLLGDPTAQNSAGAEILPELDSDEDLSDMEEAFKVVQGRKKKMQHVMDSMADLGASTEERAAAARAATAKQGAKGGGGVRKSSLK